MLDNPHPAHGPPSPIIPLTWCRAAAGLKHSDGVQQGSVAIILIIIMSARAAMCQWLARWVWVWISRARQVVVWSTVDVCEGGVDTGLAG